MIKPTRNGILTYAVIILLIVNIAVTGIVLYQKYCNHRGSGCSVPGKGMDKNLCMSEFLEKDVKFTDGQMQQFHKLKSEFHPIAKIYFDSLEMLESNFFTELVKPQTDTTKLYSFAQEFSRIQFGFKHQTIEHLIKIKSICSPEQQKKYFDNIMKNRHCREGMEMHSPEKLRCPEMKK